MKPLHAPLRRLAALALAAALAAAPALAQETPPPDAAAIAYTVDLQGAQGELADFIAEASRLISQQDRPPGSLDALRRRVENDRETISEALRAMGYYAGEVEVALDETAVPPAVTISVQPGPLFLLTGFEVRGVAPDRSEAPLIIPLDELGIALGQPAVTADILSAQDELILAFARRAHPLAEIVDRQVVVDHESLTVAVNLLVDTGPFARFGEADIQGLEEVEARFVRKRLPWAVGQPFDLRLLEQARERLVATDLFSAIRLTPADQVDEGGRLPIVIELEERKHRTIGGSLTYSTDESFGIEAYWEHRNFWGAGEKVRTGAHYNGLGYGADAAFRKPDIFGVDWDLIANLEALDVETEAYDTQTVFAAVGAELALTDIWKVSTSLALEYSFEEEHGREREFALIGLPLRATRDSSDDLLDPTEGGRFTLEFTPYYAATGEVDDFLRIQAEDSVYWQVMAEPSVILAGWAAVGTILNAGGLEQVPAQKRFYAGGGGSVRAFGFQMAGPVDANGDPTGGLSLLAFGTEARVKVTDDIGLVPFVEAGSVYDERYPDFSSDLRWGVGLGVRYYTGIGPIRADIAVPLNPREDVDDSFQVYLSFGQAF